MAQLAVIRGLTYTNISQVFNRWVIPTYRTAFRWTGNWIDAEEAATRTLLDVAGSVHLPDHVQVVDDRVVDLTLDEIARHWVDRYGVARIGRAEIYASEATPAPESLFDSLTAEMRLLLVLRFVRRRSAAAIAAQLRLRPEEAERRIIAALAQVAQRIGLAVAPREPCQVRELSTYVDDLIARRRPLRFEARPEAWPPMVGAGHLQAAIAGNDLPAHGFVRSLEKRLQAGRSRRLVTEVRIWSA